MSLTILYALIRRQAMTFERLFYGAMIELQSAVADAELWVADRKGSLANTALTSRRPA